MRVLPATDVFHLQVSDKLGLGWLLIFILLALPTTGFLDWGGSLGRCCNLVLPLLHSGDVLPQLMLICQSENGVVRAILGLDGRAVGLG